MADVAYFHYVERQVLAGCLCIFAFLGIAGNALVIAAIVLSHKLRRVANSFVFNLAVADLLTSISMPLMAVAMLNEEKWPLPMLVCSTTAFVFLMCLGCSINNLASIAVNRYVLITKKKETYQRLFSCRRVVLVIGTMWLVPLCTMAISTLSGNVQLGFEAKYSSCTWVLAHTSPIFIYILFTIFCPIQFTIIITCYLKVFIQIRKHSQAVRPKQEVATISSKAVGINIGRQRAEAWFIERRRILPGNRLTIKVTKNLFVAVCAFAVCILPHGFAAMLPNTDQALPITATILSMNSCLNPIIYAIKHPDFKTVFHCIVTRRFADIK